MANPQENKERLQTSTPELRNVILKTAFSYKRTLPANVHMIELGAFSQEAAKMRSLCQETSTTTGSMVIVDHQTTKLLITEPKLETSSHLPLLKIKIDLMRMTMPRRQRQDRSVALAIVAVPKEDQALTCIAGLLIEEKDPISPAAAMVVTIEGSHLFFRSSKTIEQTKAQNRALTIQNQGAKIADFAKLHGLTHFYCPTQGTVATPVIV